MVTEDTAPPPNTEGEQSPLLSPGVAVPQIDKTGYSQYFDSVIESMDNGGMSQLSMEQFDMTADVDDPNDLMKRLLYHARQVRNKSYHNTVKSIQSMQNEFTNVILSGVKRLYSAVNQSTQDEIMNAQHSVADNANGM